tara:strand:- start:258 stop:500 length:243 start_codon:yes stop_codon:yes gene_type:complete
MKLETKLSSIFNLIFDLNGVHDKNCWTSDNIEKWDSIGHLHLISSIEGEFDIQFEIEEIFQMDSFQNCLSLIAEKLKANK